MLSLSLNSTRAKRSLNALFRAKGPAFVEAEVKRLASDTADRVVKAVEGGYPDVPERVGTGRYRDAWIQAGNAAGSRLGRTARAAHPGDGTAFKTGSGLRVTIRVANNVEYGYQIEYGGPHLPPGGHVRRALKVVRRDATRRIKLEFKRLWEGAR